MKYIPFQTILKIQWMDSQSWHGWKKFGTIRDLTKRKDYKEHHTIGYYIAQNKDTVFISSTVTKDSSALDLLQIPLKAIKKIAIVKNNS